MFRARATPHFSEPTVLPAPLLVTLIRIGLLWAFANWGYYIILPLVHIDQSYNTSPIEIAVYFLVWFVLSVHVCWGVLSSWLPSKKDAWAYGLQALGMATLIWLSLYGFSQLPIPRGEPFVPYTDILFATPWYFLPKAVEILVQQTLIVSLVLALMRTYRNLTTVMLNYALYFGGAHVVLYLMNNAPTPYAALMTIGALLSSCIAPVLILRVRGGALYSYALHILLYVLIASLLHVYPPPDYLG